MKQVIISRRAVGPTRRGSIRSGEWQYKIEYAGFVYRFDNIENVPNVGYVSPWVVIGKLKTFKDIDRFVNDYIGYTQIDGAAYDWFAEVLEEIKERERKNAIKKADPKK